MHIVEQKLREVESFRFRKNKNKGIALLMIEKYGLKDLITSDKLEALIVDAWSYDRTWRDTLLKHEDLRQLDWEDKKILEQEKQSQLGYAIGHYQDIKKLKENEE